MSMLLEQYKEILNQEDVGRVFVWDFGMGDVVKWEVASDTLRSPSNKTQQETGSLSLSGLYTF